MCPILGNPYSDLIGGQVQVMFSPIPASIGYVRSGQLRPLAVGSTARIAILPDVPTVAEFLPGYDASGWHGIGAPKNTPADIVESLKRRSTPISPMPRSRPRSPVSAACRRQ